MTSNIENKGKADAPGQNKVFHLVVNGEQKTWDEKKISFAQVVKLAFGVYEDNPQVVYSVTYKRGDDSKPEGSMVKGDTIVVKDNELFHVSKSGES